MSDDQAQPLERLCTLWVHDDTFSKRPVIINKASLASQGSTVQHGTLLKIVRVTAGVSVHDFVSGEDQAKVAQFDENSHNDQANRELAQVPLVQDGSELDGARRHLVFVLEELEPELLTKHPSLQVSVSATVARLYGLKNRMNVLVAVAHEQLHAASHVELTFRDMYLTRADMRRLASAELWKKAVYRGQELVFLSSVRVTVRSIYVNGQKVNSALFTSSTRPIFRSESARFVLYIQMSKEMWEFEPTCSGDIVAERVINRFLPELFKRWADLKAHHAVSIVLFTRMEVNFAAAHDRQMPETGRDLLRSVSYRDYYRVVVSAMPSSEAPTIIYQLKTEIRRFLKDASTIELRSLDDKGHEAIRSVLSGTPSSAQHGNLLEAINLVTTQYAEDYIDRDLVRTGLSVMVISPGTGIFEVDENILQLTTDNLAHNGIGIDLVCLSPKPLHMTPLFCYRKRTSFSVDQAFNVDNSGMWPSGTTVVNPLRGQRPSMPTYTSEDRLRSDFQSRSSSAAWMYAQPHWLEIHYFKDHNDPRLRSGVFIPQIRMYEAQMAGRQELDMSLISIPLLSETVSQFGNKAISSSMRGKNALAWLDQYDEERFPRNRPEPNGRKVDSMRRTGQFRNLVARPRHVADIFRPQECVSSRISPENILSEQTSPNRRQSPGNSPSLKDVFVSTLKSRRSVDSTLSTGTLKLPNKADPTKKLSSQSLMFGSRGLSFTKASPVTAQSSEAATPSKQRRQQAPSGSQDPPKSGKVSDRVKSSLSRLPSSTSTVPAGSASPIPIGMSNSLRPVSEQAQDDSAGLESNSVETVKMTDEFTPRARSRFESMGTIARQKPVQSPTSIYSPWLTLVNPCRPTTTFDPAKQYRRWHHLYPRFANTSAMKWKSLCSPAALPLTTSFFPTAEELQDHYTEGIHRVAVNDSGFFDITGGRAKLLNELISFRLSKGFQVVQGQIVAGKHRATLHVNIFDETSMAEEGVTVILSKGDTIHVLCGVGSEVQVSKYHRKLNSVGPGATFFASNALLKYQPFLRTTFAESYQQHDLHFSLMPEQYNWSMVDQFLAGWDREQYSDALNVWRARFVFIPVSPPRDPRRIASGTEDTDDEIRIEGIQRITQIWERNRYHPFGERAQYAQRQDANPNPLQLDIQTRDASAMAFNGFAGAPFLIDDRPDLGASMFTQTDIDLHKLVHALQNDPSIKLQDRRWYLKVHPRCFVGSDFTTWLMKVVKELVTREDAVKFGEQLREKGLFKHVNGRHTFRDGNFFYYLCSEYREPRGDSRTSWFSRKSDKSVGSVPSTPAMHSTHPLPDVPKDLSALDYASITSLKDDQSDISTPESAQPNRPSKVQISGVMDYDVDPRRRSKRPEVIKLHYSLLYNPESCYQFRIEWLEANSKLIEDAITHWASIAEKYGHKLVQIPAAEAHKISQTIPFRSAYVVNLSVQPPDNPIDHLFDHNTGAPIAHHSNMKHGYQRALLKKYHFVLEQEAALNFPKDMQITYTWGKNDYKYNEFVNQSGQILAQIDDEGRLLFIINRLHDYRASQQKESMYSFKPERERDKETTDRPSSSALRSASASIANSVRATPYPSPSLSAISNSVAQSPTIPSSSSQQRAHHHDLGNNTMTTTGCQSAESLIREVEAFCADEHALGAFWDSITELASAEASVRNTPMLGPRDKGWGGGGGSVRGTPMLKAVQEGVAAGEKETGIEEFEL